MATKAILVTMAGYPMVPSCFMPDNGLAQLAACLAGEGHEVQIVDLNSTVLMDRLFPAGLRDSARSIVEARQQGASSGDDASRLSGFEAALEAHRAAEYTRLGEELAELARRERASWIGFKLWNGDGFTGSSRMARAIKRALPDLPILAGGPHVDFFREFLLEIETGFDYFSATEGEPTVLAFARFVEGALPIDRVPNLIFRGKAGPVRTADERVADLDALPLPLYDDAVYPAVTSSGKAFATVYEETRGCPHKCAFCNHPLKAGRQMRIKDVDRAVNEIIELRDRYGFTAFKLGGSFTPNAYMRKLAAGLIEREAGITFSGFGRIGNARHADFDLYRRAGCRALFFGVESGSQLLLDEKIDKGYQTEHCAAILEASREAGIFTIASLVYPNPGETAETRDATLALIRQARPDGAPVLFPLLLPGSQWWARPEDYGIQVPDRRAYLECAVRYKARLLFPPRHWPSMPYRIDGKPFEQFVAEAEEMTDAIEALGVITLVSDETAVLAMHAGLDVKRFRDRCRRCMLTGDVDGMQALLDLVNASLRGRTPGQPPPTA